MLADRKEQNRENAQRARDKVKIELEDLPHSEKALKKDKEIFFADNEHLVE